MRSSKPRQRSKPNRPRPIGNIVNRVFDSSGPDGKVRGTPQQIIEKYQFLARDAQLSNDRVAAENFQQHAEHYTRMLAEAQKELAAEQEARAAQAAAIYAAQNQNRGRHDERGENRSELIRDTNRDDRQSDGDQNSQHQAQNSGQSSAYRRDVDAIIGGKDTRGTDAPVVHGAGFDQEARNENDAQPSDRAPREKNTRRYPPRVTRLENDGIPQTAEAQQAPTPEAEGETKAPRKQRVVRKPKIAEADVAPAPKHTDEA